MNLKFEVAYTGTGFRIAEAQHPFRVVGVAERVQMAETYQRAQDGLRFVGEIRAVWGLELNNDITLKRSDVRALGIGGTFWPSSGFLPGEICIVDGHCIILDRDAKPLREASSVELSEEGVLYRFPRRGRR